MIMDTLQRAPRCIQWLPQTAAAFDFLRQHVGGDLTAGRHEIDGDRMFAMVSRYETRDPAIFHPEAHRRYLDVQYLVSGRETIYWSPLDEVGEPTQDYDDVKDIIFYRRNDRGRPIELSGGHFAVFLPEDAHQPGCHVGGAATEVHKIVVKVRVTP